VALRSPAETTAPIIADHGLLGAAHAVAGDDDSAVGDPRVVGADVDTDGGGESVAADDSAFKRVAGVAGQPDRPGTEVVAGDERALTGKPDAGSRPPSPNQQPSTTSPRTW
jgi:hypothetical protein